MSRKFKKAVQKTSMERKVSKPQGVKKQTTIHSRVAKSISDKRENRLPVDAKDTPQQQQHDRVICVNPFLASLPDFNLHHQVSQLAAIARSLHKTGESAPHTHVKFASNLLTTTAWTVDTLKESEIFKDKDAKLGLERMRREIFIFQQIGEVSFHLLDQVLLHNNELDEFKHLVVSWMDLCKSDHFKPVYYPSGMSRYLSLASAAEGFQVYLQAYKGAKGFNFWTLNRLKVLANDTNELLHKVETDEVQTQMFPPFDGSIINAAKISTPSDLEKHTTQATLQAKALGPNQVVKLESDIDMSSEMNIHQNTEVADSLHHYTLSLEIERSRILNNILTKQNIITEAHTAANQARAAFDKGSLLPDIREYIVALNNEAVEWTADSAEAFGDHLLQFGMNSRDLIQESLVGPLVAEKRAEDDLERYLRWSEGSKVLAGTKTVLEELAGLRRNHGVE